MPSPLKDKPLRNPGQSIDEKLINLAFDALKYLTIALMAISIAMFQWIQLLFNTPPSSLLWTITAAIAYAVAFSEIAPVNRLSRRGASISSHRTKQQSLILCRL